MVSAASFAVPFEQKLLRNVLQKCSCKPEGTDAQACVDADEEDLRVSGQATSSEGVTPNGTAKRSAGQKRKRQDEEANGIAHRRKIGHVISSDDILRVLQVRSFVLHEKRYGCQRIYCHHFRFLLPWFTPSGESLFSG